MEISGYNEVSVKMAERMTIGKLKGNYSLFVAIIKQTLQLGQ